MRRFERTIRPGSARRGFTLIEVLVAILVIGIVLALILVAVNSAGSAAQKRAAQTTVVGLGQAVRQFEQQFGFPPPLVQDGLQSMNAGAMMVPPAALDRAGTFNAAGAPIAVAPANNRIRLAATYNPAYERNRRFLEGIDPLGTGAPSQQDLINRYRADTPAWRLANQRYSKYSLAYYLLGAMPAALDGVDGPGMVRPLADGTFQGVTADSAEPLETDGRSTSRDRFDPLFNAERAAGRLQREYFDIDEYRENRGDAGYSLGDASGQTDWRHAAIVDSDGKAYRYYRWEPLGSSYGIQATATYQLNIPSVLLDEEKLNELANATPQQAAAIDLTGGDARLRGARWAIVGAGADGLFGTEPIEMLRDRLRMGSTTEYEDWEVRARAKSDNVVEVGR